MQCEYFGWNQFHHFTTAGQLHELLTYYNYLVFQQNAYSVETPNVYRCCIKAQ